jgi:hypothetical protein
MHHSARPATKHAHARNRSSARASGAVTLRRMRIPGGNQVDRRRLLLPRDYLSEPDSFGRVRSVQRVVPDVGDAASAEVAWVQHALVAEWRRRGGRPSGAALGRTFGFSRQTFSRTVLGQRWMGEAVQAALVSALEGWPVT